MRATRKALTPDERRRLSLAAQNHVLGLPQWNDANVIALYAAMPEETDTGLLLTTAWEEEKTVLLPLCSPDVFGSMELVACPGPESLRAGPYGIVEPIMDASPDRANAPVPIPDLVIVPGVAFDRLGFRLGMGGGYYDRILPGLAECMLLGLAFSLQMTDRLPRDSWDTPVHGICTEYGLFSPEPA